LLGITVYWIAGAAMAIVLIGRAPAGSLRHGFAR
jgi:hypothetical protein